MGGREFAGARRRHIRAELSCKPRRSYPLPVIDLSPTFYPPFLACRDTFPTREM